MKIAPIPGLEKCFLRARQKKILPYFFIANFSYFHLFKKSTILFASSNEILICVGRFNVSFVNNSAFLQLPGVYFISGNLVSSGAMGVVYQSPSNIFSLCQAS